jgi:hypothetical protein
MNWSIEFKIGSEDNPLVSVRINDQNIIQWIASAYVTLFVLMLL